MNLTPEFLARSLGTYGELFIQETELWRKESNRLLTGSSIASPGRNNWEEAREHWERSQASNSSDPATRAASFLARGVLAEACGNTNESFHSFHRGLAFLSALCTGRTPPANLPWTYVFAQCMGGAWFDSLLGILTDPIQAAIVFQETKPLAHPSHANILVSLTQYLNSFKPETREYIHAMLTVQCLIIGAKDALYHISNGYVIGYLLDVSSCFMSFGTMLQRTFYLGKENMLHHYSKPATTRDVERLVVDFHDAIKDPPWPVGLDESRDYMQLLEITMSLAHLPQSSS